MPNSYNIFVLGLIGSCASGTKENTSSKTTTPTVEETTSENSSSTTEPTTEENNNTTSTNTNQTNTEQQSSTVETTTPVITPSTTENNNTTTTHTTREVNHYYGNGPNGETIKGNINSKGEKFITFLVELTMIEPIQKHGSSPKKMLVLLDIDHLNDNILTLYKSTLNIL